MQTNQQREAIRERGAVYAPEKISLVPLQTFSAAKSVMEIGKQPKSGFIKKESFLFKKSKIQII